MTFDLTSNFEIAVEAAVPVVEETYQDVEVLLLSLELEEGKLNTILTQTKQLNDIVQGLSAVATHLEKGTDTVLSEHLAAGAQIATENAMRTLGEVAGKLMIGLESVDTFTNKEIAVEGISDVLAKVKGVVGGMFAKAIKLIRRIWDAIFTTLKAIDRQAVRLQEKLGGLNTEASKETIKLKGFDKLHYNGEVDPANVIEGLGELTSALTKINGPFLNAVEAYSVNLTTIMARNNIIFENFMDLTPEILETVGDYQKILDEATKAIVKGNKESVGELPANVDISGGKRIGLTNEGKSVKIMSNGTRAVAKAFESKTPSHEEIGKLLDEVRAISNSVIVSNDRMSDIFDAIERIDSTRKITDEERAKNGAKAATGAVIGSVLASTAAQQSTETTMTTATAIGAGAALKGAANVSGNYLDLFDVFVEEIPSINLHAVKVAKAALTYASMAMNAYDKAIKIEADSLDSVLED